MWVVLAGALALVWAVVLRLRRTYAACPLGWRVLAHAGWPLVLAGAIFVARFWTPHAGAVRCQRAIPVRHAPRSVGRVVRLHVDRLRLALRGTRGARARRPAATCLVDAPGGVGALLAAARVHRSGHGARRDGPGERHQLPALGVVGRWRPATRGRHRPPRNALRAQPRGIRPHRARTSASPCRVTAPRRLTDAQRRPSHRSTCEARNSHRFRRDILPLGECRDGALAPGARRSGRWLCTRLGLAPAGLAGPARVDRRLCVHPERVGVALGRPSAAGCLTGASRTVVRRRRRARQPGAARLPGYFCPTPRKGLIGYSGIKEGVVATSDRKPPLRSWGLVRHLRKALRSVVATQSACDRPHV